MEVAGQWRREWAGTAEYGKVTEGGVTRRVARAMEVLHASAPGSRVRVMRAAYHSSAGPGLPAASYLVHSSRQVISSGNRFLDTALPSIKPQEISSTPLEASQDSEAEKENYKVTEPDDLEISEPSKWKGSSVKSSIRMPSEESSSTDNASIIDLDSFTNRRSLFRRSYREKEKDESSSHKRISPLLDAPVALSTLKYTSLLNGHDDWNIRRKSYSFEDTSPLNNSLRGSDSLTIDSSTDSGIYKSTEIVDDQKTYSPKENETTFQDWLSRNRASKFNGVKTHNIYNSPIHSNNVSLKSTGKVTITLPITIEGENSSSNVSSKSNEENDRKSKKVEFCKTELHFAAESGTVNIIKTDEKPPPSSDFRKRRSAFVPLNDRFDRSIMLFGDKIEEIESMHEKININVGDIENNENTAATKSILKNKIPKPKPYLLGENMDFGNLQPTTNGGTQSNLTTPSAVSLINRQLQSRRYSDETTSSSISEPNNTTSPFNLLRTTNTGPEKSNGFIRRLRDMENFEKSPSEDRKLSSNSRKPINRELRNSDLAYFGINKIEDDENLYKQDNLQEEILHSVKLVQQISNSVSNSEVDSDDAPEYENIPFTTNPHMIPTPKPRSKYKKDIKTINQEKKLKSIPEQDNLSRTDNLRLKSKSRKDLIRQNDPSTNSEIKSTINETKSVNNASNDTNLRRQHYEPTFEYRNKEPVIETCVARKVSPLYVNVNTEKDDKKRKASNNSVKKIGEHKTCTNTSKTTTESIDRGREKHVKVNTIRRNSESPDKKKISKPQKDLLAIESNKRNDKSTPPISLQKQNIGEISKIKTSRGDKSPTKSPKQIDSTERYTKKQDKNVESKQSNNKTRYSYNKENKDGLRDYHNTNGLSTKKPMETGTSKNKLVKLENKDSENDTNTRSDSNRKSKRSQYIINYDDKHGTVSSICKIKTGAGSYTRKTVTPIKESRDEHKKDSITNKHILQQHRDQERIMEKQNYKNREKKTRVKPHNTCHLL